jgi:DNA invertase Pin-like site-specific DNA recombinase
MPRPRRTLGYARVSSAAQAEGSSLRDQQAAIEAYAGQRGLSVTRFFVEAESAIHEKIERREQIKALMNDVREGDLVLCHRLDRWSRDPEFTYGSVRKILAAGASFYAVEDQCDPSTPEGDTMLGFRVLFAREEHKRIKQRLVGTRSLLADRGYYVTGQPPRGYRRQDVKGAERNVLVVVPEEAKLVRRVFKMYVAGRSMRDIADELGENVDFVKDTLERRTYLGEVRNSRGEWIKGLHEPIIDATLFARARAACDERRYGPPRMGRATRTDGWILRDVARCARCGAKMSAGWAKDRDYYACSRRCSTKGNRATNGSWVRVQPVEEEAAEMVAARLLELRGELARPPRREKSIDEPIIARLAKRDRLMKKRERYLEAFSDGHMSRAELATALGKVDAELQRLDAEEALASRTSALERPKYRRDMLRELQAIQLAWERATDGERGDRRIGRAIVNRLVVAVAIGAGVLPAPRWRPLEALAESIVD